LWDIPLVYEHCHAAAVLGQVREFEVQVPTEAGGHWFHIVASPLQSGAAVWFADITERKRQEAQLRESDRLKDEFLATLAHELRNPLAPIRQAAQVAQRVGADNDEMRWCFDVIERQVQHMALMLDDLLDVSRITRGVLK